MADLPVTVGGKTGTAELGGSAEENGLFVCAAPYDNPEIVICSVIEHAGGGSYATIAASEVLHAYYNVD
jgi:penicillin-binding protein 2